MAARDLTVDALAAIQAGRVIPAILYEGEFVDGSEVTTYVRLWTGVGNLSWDSKTWMGGGQLLKISAIGESSRVKAIQFEVSMSGLPSDKIALALSYARRNKAGRLWLALFTAGSLVPIADPYLLKQGRFQQMPWDDSGATCTITVRYGDRLEALQRPRERRFTHEDQQLRLEGDGGFRFVEALQDAQFTTK